MYELLTSTFCGFVDFCKQKLTINIRNFTKKENSKAVPPPAVAAGTRMLRCAIVAMEKRVLASARVQKVGTISYSSKMRNKPPYP